MTGDRSLLEPRLAYSALASWSVNSSSFTSRRMYFRSDARPRACQRDDLRRRTFGPDQRDQRPRVRGEDLETAGGPQTAGVELNCRGAAQDRVPARQRADAPRPARANAACRQSPVAREPHHSDTAFGEPNPANWVGASNSWRSLCVAFLPTTHCNSRSSDTT